MKASRLFILSGVSGSGKSLALKVLEDRAFFCVDNLPASLITHFVEFLTDLPQSHTTRSKCDFTTQKGLHFVPPYDKFALLIDCRDNQAFPLVEEAVDKLRQKGTEVSILFFDCQDEVIVRRFQESRRPHPLLVPGASCQSIPEALAIERELLVQFRGAANHIIDTTRLSPHDLRELIENYLGYQRSLELNFLSFGFKYGIPYDVDLVVDVRFLPNPHFVPELHDLTGLQKEVEAYVFQSLDASAFIEHYINLLQFLLPRYKQEGKRYLTIGIGCTGGKHRSVAIAKKLADYIHEPEVKVTVRHRDVHRMS